MAARRGVIKHKQKIVRKTRSENYLTNLKFMGEEPTYEEELIDGQYANSLNWYNYMCDTSDAREYMTEYLIEYNRNQDAEKLGALHDNWVPLTACWTARMVNLGYMLPTDPFEFIDKKLDESFRYLPDPEKDAKKVKKTSSIDKDKAKLSEAIGEIERLVDVDPNFRLFDWLVSNDVPKAFVSSIVERYIGWLDELCEMTDCDDLQLIEAYGHMTDEEVLARIDFFNTLIEDGETYAGAKSERKKKVPEVKKSKPLTPEKVIKNLKFKREDLETGVKSIDPKRILGAGELYIFNTKYNTITYFKAMTATGLTVVGGSISGFDESVSKTKKTGRKTVDYVKQIVDQGKVPARKAFEDIDGSVQKDIQHRVGEHTALLKVA